MTARVGLTGGIGSGKSTVAKEFVNLGIVVIDTDLIARELTGPNCPASQQIAERFGKECLNPDGSLNRSAVGRIVFSDPDARRWLEQLLHPLIREQTARRALTASGSYCVLEVPLLIETGWYEEMDAVIVVTCPEDIRKQRLIADRGLDPNTVENIMRNQTSDEERLEVADYVIDNSADIEDIRSRVQQIHRTLETRLGQDP